MADQVNKEQPDTKVGIENQLETSGSNPSNELEGIKKMFTDGANGGGSVTAAVELDLNGSTIDNPNNLTVKSIKYPLEVSGGGTRGGKKRRKKRRSTKKKRKQKQKKRAK